MLNHGKVEVGVACKSALLSFWRGTPAFILNHVVGVGFFACKSALFSFWRGYAGV